MSEKKRVLIVDDEPDYASIVQGYLEKEGFALDKRKILLEEPIKSLGIYEVPVKLHPQVTASLKVWVVKE